MQLFGDLCMEPHIELSEAQQRPLHMVSGRNQNGVSETALFAYLFDVPGVFERVPALVIHEYLVTGNAEVHEKTCVHRGLGLSPRKDSSAGHDNWDS